MNENLLADEPTGALDSGRGRSLTLEAW